MSDHAIDLAGYIPVNNLWPEFVQRIGLDKAQHAARQAFDLQSMSGYKDTSPVLIAETCGVALISIRSLHQNLGLSCLGPNIIIIVSTRQKSFQILREH